MRPLLEEMFAASAQAGAGVHRRLNSGLHVKAALRGERRMLIVWRDGDRLPSAKECEIVGQDAGFIEPKFRTWTCKDSDSAFLVQDAFKGELCRHTWGLQVHFDGKKEYGHGRCCVVCGATWRHTFSRRGGDGQLTYNGAKVRPGVLEQYLVRGPVPEQAVPVDTDLQQATLLTTPPSESADSSVALEPPEVRTWTPKPKKEKTPAEVARQAAADTAIRARLTPLLLCIDLRLACRDPWFRRHQTIQARMDSLKGATADELRQEGRSGWFKRELPRALPYGLLVCRWRLIARALPLKATPAKRVRKPRGKKAVAAA
ncbi:hypothetical protein [Deinococcus hohokamensis]|uniref:Uncharacterized protein n=1 Tax=Deinococcus hohokamensis TaxID=309883 RepID=A0ABV9I3K2_9DEIO